MSALHDPCTDLASPLRNRGAASVGDRTTKSYYAFPAQRLGVHRDDLMITMLGDGGHEMRKSVNIRETLRRNSFFQSNISQMVSRLVNRCVSVVGFHCKTGKRKTRNWQVWNNITPAPGPHPPS
jgi:hypothetical protein